jgi:mannose-6-phosphate isomerase-like protein (cupin superfamily)
MINHRWKIKQLSKDPDNIAVDAAEVRKVFAPGKASMVHCILPPKVVSVPIRNLGIDEIWYFIDGQGEIWLKEEDEAKGEMKKLSPGSCLTIPMGVHFQYRALGEDPMTFLCVTMPPFQSREENNEEVEAHWEPS